MVMAPRLQAASRPLLNALAPKFQTCAVEHDTFPGRRAAIRLLSYTEAGTESALIRYPAAANHDVGTVNTCWTGLPCRPGAEERLIREVLKPALRKTPRTLMMMFIMLGNSISRQEGSDTESIVPKILKGLIQVPNCMIFYYEPSTEWGVDFVVTSASLHQWIAGHLFGKLGMLDQPMQSSRFDHIACDVASAAIFPQSGLPPTDTLPLLISDVPIRDKRIAEYQLRHFMLRLFGAHNVPTHDWFNKLASEATDKRWRVATVIQAAAEPAPAAVTVYSARNP